MNCFQLPPHLESQAVSELNETAENREDALRQLQDLLNSSDDMSVRSFQDDVAFLVKYLRVRKYDPLQASVSICKFVNDHQQHNDLLFHTPSEYRELYQQGIFFLMPEPNDKSQRILVYRPGLWDTNAYTLSDLVSCLFMIIQVAIQDVNCQVAGIILVEDLSGIAMCHVRAMSFSLIRRALGIMSESLPVRVKGIHLINAPRIVQGIIKLMKMIIKEKLKQRVYVHSSLELLHEHVPKACLPADFDGAQPPCADLLDNFVATMIASNDYFIGINAKCHPN